MALVKYANAALVKPGFGLSVEQELNRWDGVRSTSRKASVSVNLLDQASEMLGEQFDPSKYLLTHATIVASVDVYEPVGMKTGSVLDEGFRVNRKYSDFRIKASSDRFINNNNDSWPRQGLVKAYPTFIGAHNFQEHVQIEDLSKGRIIDAAARDIGESVYVDILIATSRQHTELIKAIETGKMSTLSMGCTIQHSTCTKCGHVAVDETEMCSHIKYLKGNVFFDKNGMKHRVAELCGHSSLDPHGGVQFIEASWVETPAFTGAVLRNVLETNAEIQRKAQDVLNTVPAKWSKNAPVKAARTTQGAWDEEGGEGEEAPAAPEAPASPLKTLEDELAKHMLDRVRKRVKKDMGGPTPDAPSSDQSTSDNENLVKQGAFNVYQASLGALVRTASSDMHLINQVSELNQSLGIKISREVYLAALKAGGVHQYPGVPEYLSACRVALTRKPSLAESRTLVRLSKLISRRKAASSSSDGEMLPGLKQGL